MSKRVYTKPEVVLVSIDYSDVVADSEKQYFSDYTWNGDYSSFGDKCTTSSTFWWATYEGGPCVS